MKVPPYFSQKFISVLILLPIASSCYAGDSASSRRQDVEVLSRAANAFSEIAKRSSPAVVSISTLKSTEATDPIQAAATGAAEPSLLGIGSGIVIKPNGLIVTNNHVVENAERMIVMLDEKHRVPAHLVGADPKTDIAVIQMDTPPPSPLSTLKFTSSDQLKVGDWAIAIGSPFGLSHSVTVGTVSAKGRAQMGILDTEDFIQTDAAINPGNSGGPLLNTNGDMIGINTAIFSQTGSFSGIGFAIPASIARDIVAQIVDHGRVIRGWLGLAAQDLDPELAKFFKTHSESGALISQVSIDGPADQAGIKSGDVITQFDSHTVQGASDFKSTVARARSGNSIKVSLMREGKNIETHLTVGEQPEQTQQIRRSQLAGQLAQNVSQSPNMGAEVKDIPLPLARYLKIGVSDGALITHVRAGGPAFDAGLFPGDIIMGANHREIHSAKDFARSLNSLGAQDTAVLFIMRGPKEKIYVPVKRSGPPFG